MNFDYLERQANLSVRILEDDIDGNTYLDVSEETRQIAEKKIVQFLKYGDNETRSSSEIFFPNPGLSEEELFEKFRVWNLSRPLPASNATLLEAFDKFKKEHPTYFIQEPDADPSQ